MIIRYDIMNGVLSSSTLSPSHISLCLFIDQRYVGKSPTASLYLTLLLFSMLLIHGFFLFPIHVFFFIFTCGLVLSDFQSCIMSYLFSYLSLFSFCFSVLFVAMLGLYVLSLLPALHLYSCVYSLTPRGSGSGGGVCRRTSFSVILRHSPSFSVILRHSPSFSVLFLWKFF